MQGDGEVFDSLGRLRSVIHRHGILQFIGMIEQAPGNSLYQILAQTLGPHKNSLYSNSMYISVHAVVGTGGDCTWYIPGLPGGDFINLFITQTYKIERNLLAVAAIAVIGTPMVQKKASIFPSASACTDAP